MSARTNSLGLKRKIFWAENILDCFHGPGRGRGFELAAIVGTGCDNPDWLGQLVAGISK